MTKQLLEAIRALPSCYVADGTDVKLCGVRIVVLSPRLIPMVWTGTEWESVRQGSVRVPCYRDPSALPLRVRAGPHVAREV